MLDFLTKGNYQSAIQDVWSSKNPRQLKISVLIKLYIIRKDFHKAMVAIFY